MNRGIDRPWRSSVLIPALVLATSWLVACGDDSVGSDGGGEIGVQTAPAGNRPESAVDDEAAERYRAKVSRRVSASVVSSLSREWGVPEAKVECLLADLSVVQLDDVATDTTVAKVFDMCGVDPGVVD